MGTRYYANARIRRLKAELIQPFLVGIISNIEGDVNVFATVQGEGRQAHLSGRGTVEDLAVKVDYTNVRYNAPYAELRVENNHIYADGVELFDPKGNKGLFNMDLDLNHLSNVTYDIAIDANKMLVLDTKSKDNDYFYGHVYATGSAEFKGDKRGLKMDIEATSNDNSHFYMPLSGKEDVSYADFVKFRTVEIQRPDTTDFLKRRMLAYERKRRHVSNIGSVMDMNMTLNVQPNIEMQLVIDPTVGDIIKGRGNGTFNMRIVPNSNIFDMYGDYTITEGSYLFTLQNIINKRFVINSGSTIQWTGDPLDARLNIDAVYSLKASLQPLLSSTTLDNVTRAVPVDCIINLTERLTAPTVTFDIKVPNADTEIQNAVANLLNNQQSIATQFMYLLVSGSFYSDASTTSNIGASASATTGFELLSNQISNWLSSDDYNIILRYRPKSELTSDEIDVGFSKSLVNDRLLLEVEGNYLVDNKMAQSSNMSNFMGEAYLTWLIDKAGALKLKGFTQTIDRFDENQGLQETGVGIYYKEDFDNWQDLKRRIRERFKSKRRRAEEEAALEEQELGATQQTTPSERSDSEPSGQAE